VLVFVAEKIHQLLRECDQIARFGGEEFVVVLPGTTLAEARLVAARIQASLKMRKRIYRSVLSALALPVMPAQMTILIICCSEPMLLYIVQNNGRDSIETDHATQSGSETPVAK
jgi:diguanylate cyclase (GGDEF)-like protein